MKNLSDTQAVAQYRREALQVHTLRNEIDTRLAHDDLRGAQDIFGQLTLKTKEFEALRSRLTPAELFIVQYAVEVPAELTVSLVLPGSTPAVRLLNDAQRLVSDQELFWSAHLSRWQMEAKFTNITPESRRISVRGLGADGLVGDHLRRTQVLEETKLQEPKLDEIMVAFAAYYIATGEPIFGWADARRSYAVHACDSPFYWQFDREGVGQLDGHDASLQGTISFVERIFELQRNVD